MDEPILKIQNTTPTMSDIGCMLSEENGIDKIYKTFTIHADKVAGGREENDNLM